MRQINSSIILLAYWLLKQCAKRELCFWISGSLLLAASALCSCNNPKDITESATSQPQSAAKWYNSLAIKAQNKFYREEDDSLTRVKALDAVLQFVAHRKSDSLFSKHFAGEKWHVDYETEAKLDFYFSATSPTLLIRTQTSNTVFVDFLEKIGGEYRNVLSCQEWLMTYTGDTIRDINGDGINDFVISGYGSSGCCLKAFSRVFIRKASDGYFYPEKEFINPTFAPKEKVVRGVEYGHPGETEMYKYRWNNAVLDTIERVYYEQDHDNCKTRHVIIDRISEAKRRVARKLHSVPKEYRQINGYDWFADSLK